uniref:serotransferrin-B-like n=1 Tax=Myxine glutinosa TaxID=7769 RepID=UPI00358F30EA
MVGGTILHRESRVSKSSSQRTHKVGMAKGKLLLFLLAFAVAQAVSDAEKTVTLRWCVTSQAEKAWCVQLGQALIKHTRIQLNCVHLNGIIECIKGIKDKKADAVTLGSEDIFLAGRHPHKLTPIAGEYDGKDQQHQDSCSYAVSVTKATTSFNLKSLRGKKSCHPGVGKTMGWDLPIGALLHLGFLKWGGPTEGRVEKAVSRLFSGSCAPGAKSVTALDQQSSKNLCSLCKGTANHRCTTSANEPYFNLAGAFKCLEDGAGQVAFVKHSTVLARTTELQRANYRLLCRDGNRARVSRYKTCNIAPVSPHAVVARSGEKATKDAILTFLKQAQKLFGEDGEHKSEFRLFGEKRSQVNNPMFRDSTRAVFRLPPLSDYRSYLGSKFVLALEHLSGMEKTGPLRWCCIGDAERQKCDTWDPSKRKLLCVSATSIEGCIWKIKIREADAMTLDGGYVYAAGKCGLVPVMSEYYNNDRTCKNQKANTPGSYRAVAVVKKSNPRLNLKNLAGKKTCHTGVNRTAGWTIPVGRLVSSGDIGACDVVGEAAAFFGSSCAPGAPKSSSLCQLCAGEAGQSVGTRREHKCEANANERYFGYTGAFRCLVEGGDVAFVNDKTVLENTDGANRASWAQNLRSSDFKLLCPDGSQAPVAQHDSCNLATVPGHAVVSRAAMKRAVRTFLEASQKDFGSSGKKIAIFSMFSSNGYKGRDLLFKDSTQCLIPVQSNNYWQFLGGKYVEVLESLNTCGPSELVETCEFDVCKVPKKYFKL